MCWADQCAITEGELGAATEAAEYAICLITRGMVGFDLDGRFVEVKEKRERSDERQRSEEDKWNADERHWTDNDEAGRRIEMRSSEAQRREEEEAMIRSATQ